jgi:hypothetical protein
MAARQVAVERSDTVPWHVLHCLLYSEMFLKNPDHLLRMRDHLPGREL